MSQANPQDEGQGLCWIGLGTGGKWFSVQGNQRVADLQSSRMRPDAYSLWPWKWQASSDEFKAGVGSLQSDLSYSLTLTQLLWPRGRRLSDRTRPGLLDSLVVMVPYED